MTQTQPPKLNSEELLRTLDKNSLLAIVQLLSSALLCPDEPLEDVEIISGYFMTDEIFNYCEKLVDDYERLKLMQLIVNTLVAEAEVPRFDNTQLVLPL